MTVHFTSDLHLGHERVAAIRGFNSAAEHDAYIADRWRNVIREDDEVWVLGDVTANSSAKVLTPAMELLRSLPGRKHLITGNHDGVHPMHRDAHKHLHRYLQAAGSGAFLSVASAARRRINGREVLLSHFPYERDRDIARHLQWRLRDEGLPLLHGHTHGTERLTRSEVWPVDEGPRLRTEIHVGLDAWNLTPVALETLQPYIPEGPSA